MINDGVMAAVAAVCFMIGMTILSISMTSRLRDTIKNLTQELQDVARNTIDRRPQREVQLGVHALRSIQHEDNKLRACIRYASIMVGDINVNSNAYIRKFIAELQRVSGGMQNLTPREYFAIYYPAYISLCPHDVGVHLHAATRDRLAHFYAQSVAPLSDSHRYAAADLIERYNYFLSQAQSVLNTVPIDTPVDMADLQHLIAVNYQ